MSENRITAELLDLLGLEAFLALVEAHGGTRLYVPRQAGETQIVRDIGPAAASRLVERYGGDYVRVPLAREHRARRLREEGLSNAQIARRLGMSESGVERLFHAMPAKPRKGVDPRQGSLFSLD